jgi:hypothetical protein
MAENIAVCDECGQEVWFDAYVTLGGEVVNIFDDAYCPGCSEEIKYSYTVKEG